MDVYIWQVKLGMEHYQMFIGVPIVMVQSSSNGVSYVPNVHVPLNIWNI